MAKAKKTSSVSKKMKKVSKFMFGKHRSLAFLAMLIGTLTACNGYQFPIDISAENNTTSNSSSAQVSSCLTQFHQATPPYLHQAKMQKSNYALCYNGFSVLYSGVSKTPIWVAEYLNPERLSVKIKREDHFHEEERILSAHRATLADYRGSGYDRGHMAPNADMNNTDAQYDSFALTNMVPQAPKNNQGVWRELEEATRSIVTKHQQEVYVVTGPTFETSQLKQIGQGVLVPTAVYKAIYAPKSGIVGAYYANNDDSGHIEIMSICELERKTGINIFPQLDEEKKRQIYHLPLNAGAVKANKAISLDKTDKRGKCANPVSRDKLQWLQQQFKPEHFQPLKYQSSKNNTATTEPQIADIVPIASQPNEQTAQKPEEQSISQRALHQVALTIAQAMK